MLRGDSPRCPLDVPQLVSLWAPFGIDRSPATRCDGVVMTATTALGETKACTHALVKRANRLRIIRAAPDPAAFDSAINSTTRIHLLTQATLNLLIVVSKSSLVHFYAQLAMVIIKSEHGRNWICWLVNHRERAPWP